MFSAEYIQSMGFAIATFAGGCFWCMQPPFDALEGVVETTVGYTGGSTTNPTYEQVSSGTSGHTEAVRVVFNPRKISYQQLLEVFWRNIDPTNAEGQFADRGSQYRTAIFFHSPEQQQQGQKSRELLQASGKFDRPLVTPIVAATPFYEAEEYHQFYYRKKSQHYQQYKVGSGRSAFLKKHWGDTHP
jgi:methionine-S-sulfoxide reductase